MTRAAALWTLLALFAGRVFGQLAVVLDVAPFLPPMEQWQSGLMPYPALLAAQFILLVTFGIVCAQFTRGRGYFVEHGGWLETPLWIAGWIYASSMVVRYAVWMTIRPDERWTGDLIPVVFHLVLASFLLVVAHHHRHRVYDHQRTRDARHRLSAGHLHGRTRVPAAARGQPGRSRRDRR